MNVTRALYLLSKYIKIDAIGGWNQVYIEIVLILLTLIIPVALLLKLSKHRKQLIVLFSGVWLCTAGCFMNTYIKHAQNIIKLAELEKIAGSPKIPAIDIVKPGGPEAARYLREAAIVMREAKLAKDAQRLNELAAIAEKGPLTTKEQAEFSNITKRINSTQEDLIRQRALNAHAESREAVRKNLAENKGKFKPFTHEVPKRTNNLPKISTGDPVADTLQDLHKGVMSDGKKGIYLGPQLEDAYRADKLAFDGVKPVEDGGKIWVRALDGTTTKDNAGIVDKRTGMSYDVDKHKFYQSKPVEHTPSAGTAPAKESPKPEDKAVDPNDKTTWKRNPKNPNEIINPLVEKYKDLLALRDRAAKARTAAQDVTGRGRIDLSAEDLNLLREDYKNPEIKSAVDDIIKYHKETYLNSDLQGYLDGNRTVFRNPSDGKVVFDNTWSPEDIAKWLKEHPEDTPKNYIPEETVAKESISPEQLKEDLTIPPKEETPEPRVSLQEQLNDQLLKGQQKKVDELRAQSEIAETDPFAELAVNKNVAPRGDVRNKNNTPEAVEHPPKNKTLLNRISSLFTSPFKRKTLNLGENVDSLRTPEEFVDYISKIDTGNPDKAIDDLYAIRRRFSNSPEYYEINDSPLNFLSKDYFTTPELDPIRDALRNIEQKLGVHYDGAYFEGGKHIQSKNLPDNVIEELKRIKKIKGSPEEVSTQLNALSQKYRSSNSPDDLVVLNAISEKGLKLGFDIDPETGLFATPKSVDPAVEAFNKMLKSTGEQEVPSPISKAEQTADVTHRQNGADVGPSVENAFLDSVPAAAEKIKEIQNVRQNIEDAYKAILTNRKNLNKLDPADPRVPIIKEDLDKAYTSFSQQLETLNKLENKDFSREWPQAIAAKGVVPENVHYSQNGDSIILSAKGMSVEEAAALQAQNPEAITLLGRDNTGAIQIGFNTKSYLESLPFPQRISTELGMRTITGETNPFLRSRNPLQRDSLAKGVPELIDRQLEAIRNLERKRVIQNTVNDPSGVTKTEGELRAAKDILSKYEKLTPETVGKFEQELDELNSGVNPNLTLDADLNRLQFTADSDLERRLFEAFPTEESRKVINGFKIIPKGSDYYPETLHKNPGAIVTTSPGRKAERTTIIPEYIHIGDGITNASGKKLSPIRLPNDLSNLIRKPGKGEMTWKFKSPLEESAVTDIRSMLERNSSPVNGLSIKNIDQNGITFDSKFPLYKAFRDSGVGRDSFGTQFADAYYLGGTKDINGDPAGVIKGMGILPKTLAGFTGISVPVVGTMLANNSTEKSNSQLDALKNPFLRTVVNGDETYIINPYGSRTMLNPDGTYVSMFPNPKPDGEYTYVEGNPAKGYERIIKTDPKGRLLKKPQIEKKKPEVPGPEAPGPETPEDIEKKTGGGFNLGKWNEKNLVPEYFSNKENFGSYGHSLFGALAGGALGAGIGGLNYILTDENELSEEEKKKRSLARAMLSSAGIGAGIGGLVGGASDYTRA